MKPIKVLLLQLDVTEGPGFILDHIISLGIEYKVLELFRDSTHEEDVSNFTHLLVLPTPKNIEDVPQYDFLNTAKLLIQAFITHQKHILGVCMGAQLVAHCLGEDVLPMKNPEVGFFQLHQKADSILTRNLDFGIHVFEWHSMEIATLKNISVLASSERCRTQMFQYEERVFGVQCHLEMTEPLIELYLETFDQENVHAHLKNARHLLEAFHIFQRQLLNNFLLITNEYTKVS